VFIALATDLAARSSRSPTNLRIAFWCKLVLPKATTNTNIVRGKKTNNTTWTVNFCHLGLLVLF
jgi:hypothetical protein